MTDLDQKKVPRKLKKKCKRVAKANVLTLHGINIRMKDFKILSVSRKDKDFLVDFNNFNYDI